MSTQSLAAWFNTPLGHYLLRYEQAYFDGAVVDIFGFNAVQIELNQFNFLQANRMPVKFHTGFGSEDGEVELKSDPCYLPLESESIDLVILPHGVDFNQYPHQVLREAARVLRPEGRLILSGFNPWSLWGLKRLFTSQQEAPWSGNFVSLVRIKDWLTLLGLEIQAGKLACYAPPFSQEKWLNRFGFMEKAGDRWWPIAGGVYFLQAVKHVHGMTVITPNWREAMPASNKALASVVKKLGEQ